MKKRLLTAATVTLLPLLLLQGCGAADNNDKTATATATTNSTYVFPTTSTTSPPAITTTQHTHAPKRQQRASRGNLPARVYGYDVWAKLAQCESGGRPNAVSRSGKYFGLYQFSLKTWRGIGETGNPIDYSGEYQLAAAKRLQARSGWGQWPTCARRLGLI